MTSPFVGCTLFRLNSRAFFWRRRSLPKAYIFLSSPIKRLYWVELLTEVSSSNVCAIPRNWSPKKPKIGHRQPPFWNKCLAARLGRVAKHDVIPSNLNFGGKLEVRLAQLCAFRLFFSGCLCENAVVFCPRIFKDKDKEKRLKCIWQIFFYLLDRF